MPNPTLTLTFRGLGTNPGSEANTKIVECWTNSVQKYASSHGQVATPFVILISQTGKGEADDSQTAELFTADGTYTITTTDILLLMCFLQTQRIM